MTLLLLIFSMIFNMLAQSTLKHAVSDMRFDSFTVQTVSKFLFSPSIWIGAVVYGASFFFYVFALSRGELSRISPVSQALTTLGIVIISIFVFNEPLTIFKGVGLLLLFIGTIIIFM